MPPRAADSKRAPPWSTAMTRPPFFRVVRLRHKYRHSRLATSVHDVIYHVVVPYRLKRARTDVQRNERRVDPLRAESANSVSSKWRPAVGAATAPSRLANTVDNAQCRTHQRHDLSREEVVPRRCRPCSRTSQDHQFEFEQILTAPVTVTSNPCEMNDWPTRGVLFAFTWATARVEDSTRSTSISTAPPVGLPT